MRADKVEVGDTIEGHRVEATWTPADGWRAIQTVDGRTMMAEDDHEVPADQAPHPSFDLGLGT